MDARQGLLILRAGSVFSAPPWLMFPIALNQEAQRALSLRGENKRLTA